MDRFVLEVQKQINSHVDKDDHIDAKTIEEILTQAKSSTIFPNMKIIDRGMGQKSLLGWDNAMRWAVIEFNYDHYIANGPEDEESAEDWIRGEALELLEWRRFNSSGPGRAFGREPECSIHGSLCFLTQEIGLDV